MFIFIVKNKEKIETIEEAARKEAAFATEMSHDLTTLNDRIASKIDLEGLHKAHFHYVYLRETYFDCTFESRLCDNYVIGRHSGR